MKSYKFKYRKSWFFKSISAIGHRYDKEIDRMDVYHENGSITSLSKWSNYDLFLGVDWVLFTKEQMEKESGQDIKLKV
jgi:hypothetical protein